MKQELQNKLFKKFPEIFADRNKPITESPMKRGITCGDGWYDLIYDLCRKIKSTGIPVVAEQVKEKFGGLRFFARYSSPRITSLIFEAEAKSLVTCDTCGKKGHQVINPETSFVLTVCDKHEKAYFKYNKTI